MLFFASTEGFERAVAEATEKAVEKITDKLAKDYHEDLIKKITEEAIDNLPDSKLQELENKLFAHVGELRYSVNCGHGSYGSDKKWWEEYPYQDTIASEAFLDFLIERINRKQIKGYIKPE